MLYTSVKIVSRIVSALPKPLWHGAGRTIGEMCWPLVPAKRKRMAIDNIMCALAVGPEEATAIAKKSVTRFGPMFMEVLRMPKLDKSNISRYVKLEGAEHLTNALAQGRGAVLATAHSGNWELLGAALAMHGFPLVAVAQKQTNAAMDRFINEYRTMAGMHVTYKSGVLEMVRMLGEGWVIGLLMDQDQHESGVFVNFFGRPASTPPGAAVLARMKNAPIVPAFITRNADGTHTAVIYPAVTVEKTKDKHRDVFRTTAQLTAIVEKHVRCHPEEWFWLHNRWKTAAPAGWNKFM